MTIRRLQDYVTRQAERRPEATALVLGDRALTYGALEARSNQLARLLEGGGCRPGDRIGLMLPKSPSTVAAMLAVLKAGGIYVPVDPESPALRVERILGAADCRYVLATAAALPLLEELQPRLSAATRPWVVLMGPAEGGDHGLAPTFTEADADVLSAEPPGYQAGADDPPAHILFTSGSTGVPKGVVVGHDNVIAFVAWANHAFGLDRTDRVSCHSPLHFDLSTYDLYGAFAAGAEVHLVPPELNLFPGRLIELIRDHRLTQWFSVPSILTYLARFDAVGAGDFPELKRLLWCGEVFPTPSLRYWMERLPHVAFTNLYGPTEATIASSYYTVPAVPADVDATVPIGAACGGEEILILGEDMAPTPEGEVGEICIGGAGVTRGYWRDEDKTRRAFRSIEGATGTGGGRIYRTGDLGYRGGDGLLRLLGRTDSQIKSRGHRIELGEIEAAAHDVAEVGQSAVVAIEAAFGSHTICCAYVLRPGLELAPEGLKARLAAALPRYMLPTRWRRMEAFPANANGKVDRVALAEMFRDDEVKDGANPRGE